MNHIQPLPALELALQPTTRMEQNKALLLETLKAAGAVHATVSYSGGGDEGSAESVEARGVDGTPIDLSGSVSQFVEHSHYADGRWQSAVAEEERPLDDALLDFAMEAVDAHHGGWENNDGGAGEVIFDCTSGSVRLEHRDYYTESIYTETTL
ncbi:DUF6878 family protein [Ottowia sp.]|uniref:DUF6878 family protein n=1 Tax=Ottowia sp. TaxID=1898956 RepID=UPI00260F0AC0|nr:DUF6878 family protein [Ottowia sp.]